jgi:hypothetical protein
MNGLQRPPVVFTTPVLGHPAVGGPALRVENSILALGAIAELHILSRADWWDLGGRGAAGFFGRVASSFRQASGRGAVGSALRWLSDGRFRCLQPRPGRRFANAAGYVIRGAFSKVQRAPSAARDAAEVVALARRTGAKVVWFGYGNISFDLMREVRGAAPDLRLVCDTDSVWSRFVLREVEVERDPERRARIEAEGKAKEIEEADWVRMCDVTTAVSEVDAAYYEGLNTSGRRVMLFRNVVNMDSYASAPPPAPDLRTPSIFLAGTFWEGSPMQHAATWFVREVLPLVTSALPEVQVYIAGQGSDVVLRGMTQPGVHVLGRVPTVLPYLCHSGVSVVPLFFESGTRFKILEAGACGVAVVSTTLGAEGIPAVDGEHLLLADAPGDFASAVTRLLRDPEAARAMGSRLRDLVRRDFSLDALTREGAAILRALGATPG